jgi:beta-glucosidase-like glycosyl hydrolase
MSDLKRERMRCRHSHHDRRHRPPFQAALAAAAFLALLPLAAHGQSGLSFAPPAESQAAQPSSSQLASPAIEKRVDALLRQMTLEEKLGQLVQYGDTGDSAVAPLANAVQAPGKNPETHVKIDPMQLAATGRLGSMLNVVGAERTNAFQRAAVEKSRLHIPLLFGADILHGYRTIYPVPLGLAATFDPQLVSSLAHISAAEATTAGVRWFYSPMVDISRDPRWGRTQEGAGEDAYHGSAMARAYIRGYQGGDLSKPDSVAASVKHFAAYGAAEAGREYNTTDMSLSRLEQDYLPPYKAAVEEGAATMMSAFNALNGVPSTANSFLLNETLRHEWGFDGFVVSDYTAVMELRNHGIAQDAATAAQKALLAGVDVDMMSHYYDTELPALIRSGRVPISAVDIRNREVLVGVGNGRIGGTVHRCFRHSLIGNRACIVGEVALLFKCLVAGGLSAAAEVLRTKIVVTAVRAVERLRCPIVWRPAEARVDIEDSAQRPAAHGLFEPVMRSVEDNRLPEAKYLEGVADVVVGATAGVRRVVRVVRVFLVGLRCVVHASGPHELRVERELAGERMLHLGQHCVIAGAAFVAVVVEIRNQRVQRRAALGERGCVSKVLNHEVPAGAPLIAERGDDPVAELVLKIQGVMMLVLCGKSACAISEDKDAGVAGYRKIHAVVCGDGVRIRGEAAQRFRAARYAVYDVGSVYAGIGWAGKGEVVIALGGWIGIGVS